jgi:hypothetical protein
VRVTEIFELGREFAIHFVGRIRSDGEGGFVDAEFSWKLDSGTCVF